MAGAIVKAKSPTQQLVAQRAGMAMRRVQDAALKRRHTAAVSVFAAGVGYYEKSGRTLPSIIPGVPPKIQMAVLAAIVADNTTGDTKAYAQALCDGLGAIVGYQFGKGETIGDVLGNGAADVVDV